MTGSSHDYWTVAYRTSGACIG